MDSSDKRANAYYHDKAYTNRPVFSDYSTIEEWQTDLDAAITSARSAVQARNLNAAAAIINRFDSKWAFRGTDKRIHGCLFSNADVSEIRLRYTYALPLMELHNSSQFKRDMNAHLVLCSIVKSTFRSMLEDEFYSSHEERIDCPTMIEMYRESHDEEDEEDMMLDLETMLSRMQEQAKKDNRTLLRYFVSYYLRDCQQIDTFDDD